MFKLRAGGGRLFRWLRAGPLMVGGATPRGWPNRGRVELGREGGVGGGGWRGGFPLAGVENGGRSGWVGGRGGRERGKGGGVGGMVRVRVRSGAGVEN